MNPIVLAIGKVLRLVGISSPEDNAPKAKLAADPPSWRERPQQQKTQHAPSSDADLT
jgi:hypothetical protein